jgi:integrase
MARRPEPRWYQSRGGWYVCIGGKQHRLAVGKESKAEAWKAYHRLMLEGRGPAKGERITAAVLCDLLLDWVKQHREPETYTWYKRHLQSFVDHCGSMKADEITPGDVARWLSGKAWGRSTRHGAIGAVKRAFRWGVRNHFLASDPLANLDRPGCESRQGLMTAEQFRAILAASDRHFRDLLTVLHETGMRPSEAYRLTARDIDWQRHHAIFRRHKTSRESERPRVVYLTPGAMELLRRLAEEHPDGPVLRNKAGGSWTRHSVARRFARLRGRFGFGKELTADGFRHLFITDGLDAGIPIATLAELAGHRSTKMIEHTYSHLSERREHLERAVRMIRPEAKEPGSSDPPSSP